MSNITIREYKIGDAKKIYSLFSQYTPYRRDEKFWVWINRIIQGKSIVVVAEINGEIIGHYAALPSIVVVNKIQHKALFAIHAFVHPDFRNSFLIFQLTKKMYNLANKYNISFIYGFPNSNFYPIQLKIDKWKKVSIFSALEKKIKSCVNVDSNCRMIHCEDNYSSYFYLSELIDKKDKEEKKFIYIKRDINYYINRYIRHPQNLYNNFFITLYDKIVAFISLKKYEKDGIVFGHIVDYIASKDIKFDTLLSIVENYFFNNITILSVWKFNNEVENILYSEGFKDTGFETFFGIKMIKNNKELENKLIDFSNWSLCMGDSDAF